MISELFYKKGTDMQQPIQKEFLTTWLLSLLVGVLGIDRFYLGKIGTGILKLVTFGGFGVWALIDLILVLTGNTRDKQGRELANTKKYQKVAVFITVGLFVLSILGGASGLLQYSVLPS